MALHTLQSVLLSRQSPLLPSLQQTRYLHATTWLKFFTQPVTMKYCLMRLVPLLHIAMLKYCQPLLLLHGSEKLLAPLPKYTPGLMLTAG
jgi:hypothetical protein